MSLPALDLTENINHEQIRSKLVADRPPPAKLSTLRRIRVWQIRVCSRWICILCQISAVFPVIKAAREVPVFRQILAGLTGYNRPFQTFSEANAALAGYEGIGHSDPRHATILMQEAARASASDYAALFFLRPIVSSIRNIFDFGGNVGNLFYCYAKYLDFPPALTWTVFDLPGNIAVGEQIANTYKESRLRFTSSLADGDGADLLIASGALHYFAKPLPDILAEFSRKPQYVLVNRTPLVERPSFATVQDVGEIRVACMLYNQEDLIRRFAAAGYELVELWSAFERSLVIPCYPDWSVRAYSGMFFKLKVSVAVDRD